METQQEKQPVPKLFTKPAPAGFPHKVGDVIGATIDGEDKDVCIIGFSDSGMLTEDEDGNRAYLPFPEEAEAKPESGGVPLYDPDAEYQPGDVVRRDGAAWEGSTWVCIKECRGFGVANAEYWEERREEVPAPMDPTPPIDTPSEAASGGGDGENHSDDCAMGLGHGFCDCGNPPINPLPAIVPTDFKPGVNYDPTTEDGARNILEANGIPPLAEITPPEKPKPAVKECPDHGYYSADGECAACADAKAAAEAEARELEESAAPPAPAPEPEAAPETPKTPAEMQAGAPRPAKAVTQVVKHPTWTRETYEQFAVTRTMAWMKQFSFVELATKLASMIEERRVSITVVQNVLNTRIPRESAEAMEEMLLDLDQHRYAIEAALADAEALLDRAQESAMFPPGAAVPQWDVETGKKIGAKAKTKKDEEVEFEPKYKEVTDTYIKAYQDADVVPFRKYRNELKALQSAMTERIFNLKRFMPRDNG